MDYQHRTLHQGDFVDILQIHVNQVETHNETNIEMLQTSEFIELK